MCKLLLHKVKQSLPEFLIEIIRFNFAWVRLNAYKFISKITVSKVKIVLGCGNSNQKGWFSTDRNFLNIVDSYSWSRLFDEKEIDNLLAEHVFDYLTEYDIGVAARLCYRYLKDNGTLRIAVCDGLHTSENYINYNRNLLPDYGQGAILYDYRSLYKILSDAGFEVRLIEYFDKSGTFHSNHMEVENGDISRSYKNDKRNKNDGRVVYSSLILDCIKMKKE